jgi:hypothetical protein
VVPIGDDGEEGWERDVEDQDLRGVGAFRFSGAPDVWQVEVAVAELLREDPLEAELRRGIEAALHVVPGVIAVAEEDREIWLVEGTVDGSELVRAAGAVVDAMARRVARHLDELDRDATVDTATLAHLADAVAPRLEALGFTRVEDRYGPTLFRRHLGHSVVQSVTLRSFARSNERGRVQPAEIWIAAGVLLPPHHHPATPEDLPDLAGGATLNHEAWAAPNATAVETGLIEEMLPWLAGTAGRAALAAWAGTDPTRVAPPILRPRVAELLAGWGFAAEARAILDFLEADDNRYLATRPEANRARELLGER